MNYVTYVFQKLFGYSDRPTKPDGCTTKAKRWSPPARGNGGGRDQTHSAGLYSGPPCK